MISQDHPDIQALLAWLGRDEEGRAVLARFRADPHRETEALAQWLEARSAQAPPQLASYISGGQIEKLINIAHAGTVVIAQTRHPNRDRRLRRAMLDKVHAIWISGYLQRSLAPEILIDLDLTERPTAVDPPLELLVQHPDRVDRILPSGTRIVDVFDELDQALLILGNPGSGKTTLLLQLAQSLLDRAAQDPDHPIPVVFPLSSWAERRRPLENWLVEELVKRYSMARKIAQRWMAADQILPLLDGLDELKPEHRADCVKAINTFRQSHGLLPLIVCSRTADYEALNPRLELQGAVVVRPLTYEQVDSYLGQHGQSLAAVREALHEDRVLWEVLDTPLMLTIVTLASTGDAAAALSSEGTLEERRAHLWSAYVDGMFRRRSPRLRYSPQEAVRWLAWLAWQMTQHAQTEFHLTWMRLDWLPQEQHGALTRGMRLGLRLFLALGITLSIGLGLESSRWGSVGLGSALGLGLGFGLGGRWRVENEAASEDMSQTASLSWPQTLTELLAGMLGGLLGGVLIGVGGRLGIDLPSGLGIGLNTLAGLGSGVVGGLVGGFGIALLPVLCVIELKPLIDGLAIGLYGLGIGVFGVLGIGLLVRGLDDAFSIGVVCGLLIGVIGGVGGGLGRISNSQLDNRPAYTLLSFGLLIGVGGLLSGVAGGWLIGVIGGMGGWLGSELPVGLLGLGSGLGSGLGIRLGGLGGGLGIGLLIGLLIGVGGISSDLASMLSIGLLAGLSGGLLIGLIRTFDRDRSLGFELIFARGIIRRFDHSLVARDDGSGFELGAGLGLGLGSGLGIGLLIGVGGLSHGLGIRLSPWGGIGIGLLAGLGIGLFGGLVGDLLIRSRAYLQYVVLRCVLIHNGSMPWHSADFLDYAVERIFLRKVGGGYMFTHRLLQDYFTTLHAEADTAADAHAGRYHNVRITSSG